MLRSSCRNYTLENRALGWLDVMSTPSLQAMPRCTDRPLPACQGTGTAIYHAVLLLLYFLPAINSQTIISPCLIAGPVSWLAQNGIRACGILQITSRGSCHRNRNQLCGKALPSAASSVFPSSSSCFTEGWHGEHPWGNALPLRQCASVRGRLRLHVQGRILPWRCHAEDQATNWEACRAQAQWSITRPDE